MSEIVWVPSSMRDEKIKITKDEGYEFRDENGNVINATRIVLEKKKKEYPKTYEECCEVLGFKPIHGLALQLIVTSGFSIKDCQLTQYERELTIKLERLRKVLICLDAYWKIAGEEMGLGEPWRPDWNAPNKTYYTIIAKGNEIYKSQAHKFNEIFAFPTPEMRDAFKENFDADLEFCKEFL